ncbi:hypothetical protein ABVT39_007248, partial [Epinephelus coioides]
MDSCHLWTAISDTKRHQRYERETAFIMKHKLSAIKELNVLMMRQHAQHLLHHGGLLRGSRTLRSDGKSHKQSQ